MSLKRASQIAKETRESSGLKKLRTEKDDIASSYLSEVLEESGLILNSPPIKCTTTLETVHLIRNIKKNLQKHSDYPTNVSEFFKNIQKQCQNWDVFKHYLYPNIVKTTIDNNELIVNDSVMKILLSVPILQTKLMDFIFDKAIDLATESKCGLWIQAVLKCFATLDNLIDTEKMSTNLINLLDIASEKFVRLEIITAIPDIIGDQEHDNVAVEMSRILSEDHELIPAILDCLSYLCLSDEQYEKLQKKTINILMSLSKCNYFPNFVKFLLMPRGMTDCKYLEVINDLRNALGWSTSFGNPQDIASSQVLTATAIRNSMVSSKVVSNAWMKVVSNCKESCEQKPIDIIIMLILYTTSEEKQKQVELLLMKQIKNNVLKEDLLVATFKTFKPILEVNLRSLIILTNSLLKAKSNLEIQEFATYMYTQMFSTLEECCQTIIAELLQLCSDCKHCVMNILTILNNVAEKNVMILKPQYLQMLMLLDRMDDMNIFEKRAVLNLLCCLAYTCENSAIRDDVHMIIRKELGSSNPTIKVQGVIAGIYAVKYLMAGKNGEDTSLHLSNDVSFSSVDQFREGDLREAAQIVELISRSTRQFPDMIVLFYDELSKLFERPIAINKHFLVWLTDAVTNDLQQNFIVDDIEDRQFGNIKLSMQFCLNSDSEIDEVTAINIGGLIWKCSNDINICLLSPLFQLVQALHLRQHDGNLSSVDVLLGCAVVMPICDIDEIKDKDIDDIRFILDCFVYCINWFRELINAFASQNDPHLHAKIFKRILQVQQLESLVERILLTTNITYKIPSNTLNIRKDDKIIPKVQSNKLKNSSNDESILPETGRTQGTQNSKSLKSKTDFAATVCYRPLSLNVTKLLNHALSNCEEIDDISPALTIEGFKYIIRNICFTVEPILISKLKQKTFFNKNDTNTIYDKTKAGDYAKCIYESLAHLMGHFKCIISEIEILIDSASQNESEFIYNSKTDDLLVSLENIYNLLAVYFKWIGFKSDIALLKTSLRIINPMAGDSSLAFKDLLVAVVKCFQQYEKYCLQLSTAVSFIELLKSLQGYSSSREIHIILKDTANNFLSKQWKAPNGALERGLLFNKSIDSLAKIYLLSNEVLELKNIALSLLKDIDTLKNRNNSLNSFKSINKSNFPVFYRNLGTALHEITKLNLNKRLTNEEHLDLWKDVTYILKCMSDMAKSLDSRSYLSSFFKKSLPTIKLFLSHGIPIIELQFKSQTQEALEILKTLQQTTRFLQSLCCHSRLKKDSVLMSKVPSMRQLLETLIYKVKAALTANNCSEAFWMGNLKNKNIHGEVITSQQSEEEYSVEDCDDQLPEDDSDETDDEMMTPDTKGLSDIV